MPDNKKDFSINYEFTAPVEKVFAALSSIEQLKKWYAPKDYEILFGESDIKPGGAAHYCLASKHGMEMWRKLFFKDVIPPAKISFTQCYSNESGGIERHPMIPSWPIEIMTTFMLDEKNGKTTLELTWEPLNVSEEEFTKFIDGVFELSQEWGALLEQLDSYLKTK